MPVLPIYTDGSPVLRKKAQSVKRLTDDIIQLIMNMFETMRKANGIGLAANQVGVLLRIITIDVSDVEGLENTKPLVLINPKIVEQSGSCIMEEGCLSVPEIRDKIERPETVKIRFKNTNFEDMHIEADGILARVFLHEIDHLNGILFIDYLSSDKKNLHMEALEKIHRGDTGVSYPVVNTLEKGR